MKLQFNFQKKHLLIILLSAALLFAATFAIAYGTSNPANFGHSLNEMDFGGKLAFSDTYTNIRSGSASLNIDNSAGTANLISIKNNGDVGIGTGNPSEQLTLTGNILIGDSRGTSSIKIGTFGHAIGREPSDGSLYIGGGQAYIRLLNTVQIPAGNSLCLGADCRSSWPSGGTGGSITINTENGIYGGGTATVFTIGNDFNNVQKRVTGTCAAGYAVSSISSTGAVACTQVTQTPLQSYTIPCFADGRVAPSSTETHSCTLPSSCASGYAQTAFTCQFSSTWVTGSDHAIVTATSCISPTASGTFQYKTASPNGNYWSVEGTATCTKT